MWKKQAMQLEKSTFVDQEFSDEGWKRQVSFGKTPAPHKKSHEMTKYNVLT